MRSQVNKNSMLLVKNTNNGGRILLFLVLVSMVGKVKANIARDFFPEMPEKQKFCFKKKENNFTKNNNFCYEIYLSQTPFFEKNGTRFYSFYIKYIPSTYTDTIFLSKKNDTIFASAYRYYPKGTKNKSLKRLKTIPLIDLKRLFFIDRNYQQTSKHSFDYFSSGIKYHVDSISNYEDDILFQVAVDQPSLRQSIKRMFFSMRRGIYSIELK